LRSSLFPDAPGILSCAAEEAQHEVAHARGLRCQKILLKATGARYVQSARSPVDAMPEIPLADRAERPYARFLGTAYGRFEQRWERRRSP